MPAFQAESASKQPEEEADFLKHCLEISGPEGVLRMRGALHGDRGTATCVQALVSPQAPYALSAQSPALSVVHCPHCRHLAAGIGKVGMESWVTRGSLQLLESGKCKGGWTGMLET